MLQLELSGDVTLEGGGYVFRLRDQNDEFRMIAPSIRSLWFLVKNPVRGRSLPKGFNATILLCLQARPLASLQFRGGLPAVRPHLLRFLKKR